MTERLLSIRPRLQELARLDPEERVVSAESGDLGPYELAPPLSEAEVIDFEARHGIMLPDDYRRFLLEVGSHGTGPGYEFHRLGATIGSDEKMPPDGFLATPFPLKEWLNLVDNPDHLSEEEINSNKWVTGTLFLGTWGCGMDNVLVVSGEERGHMWMDDRSNQYGIFPLAPNREQFGESQEDALVFTQAEGERISFLDWYEWWLDWSLAEVKKAYREDESEGEDES